MKNKDIKMISARYLLDILVWLDVKKINICCIETLRYILLMLEVLVCLVSMSSSIIKRRLTKTPALTPNQPVVFQCFVEYSRKNIFHAAQIFAQIL
jgi:hypothetical protein